MLLKIKIPKDFSAADITIKLVGQFLIVEAVKTEGFKGEDFSKYSFKTVRKISLPKSTVVDLTARLIKGMLTITSKKSKDRPKNSIKINTRDYIDPSTPCLNTSIPDTQAVEKFYAALALL